MRFITIVHCTLADVALHYMTSCLRLGLLLHAHTLHRLQPLKTTFHHRVCMHTYMHTYIPTHLHTSVNAWKTQPCVVDQSSHVCLPALMHACVCVRVCVHACIHTYVHTYIRTYIHAHKHAYIPTSCISIRPYIHKYVHIHTC